MKEQKSSDDAHAPTPAESANCLNAMSFMRGWLGQDEKNRPAIAKSVEAERKLKRDLHLEEIADQKNRQKKVKSEAPVHIINGKVVSIMERIDITDENKEGELNSVSTQFTKIIAPIQHLDPASPADSIDSQQTLPLGSPPSKSKDISATNALLLLAAAGAATRFMSPSSCMLESTSSSSSSSFPTNYSIPSHSDVLDLSDDSPLPPGKYLNMTSWLSGGSCSAAATTFSTSSSSSSSFPTNHAIPSHSDVLKHGTSMTRTSTRSECSGFRKA